MQTKRGQSVQACLSTHIYTAIHIYIHTQLIFTCKLTTNVHSCTHEQKDIYSYIHVYTVIFMSKHRYMQNHTQMHEYTDMYITVQRHKCMNIDICIHPEEHSYVHTVTLYTNANRDIHSYLYMNTYAPTISIQV